MYRNIIEINTFEESRIIKADHLSNVHMRDNNMLIINLTMGPSIHLTFLSREEKKRCYEFLKVVMEGKINVDRFDEQVVINAPQDVVWILDELPECQLLS